ncbi:MAG: ABC transporter ATP-binding protein [Candidatus Helarchaeota archaeon]
MLSIVELTKYFKNIKALDRVSFEIEKGKIVGLLGPNGAGKTTTIRIITGIIPKTSGKILYEGKELDPRKREWKQRFGVVPEVSNAFLDYNVIKNLRFISGIYKIPRKEAMKRSKELIKEFGIEHRVNIKTKKLSKGEKQRLNLCLAMIHDPEIYFLDEPTTGLDIRSTQLIRNKILELKRQNKTILLTTHNLIEANKLCDKIIILNKGKVVAIGTTDELRQKFAPYCKISIDIDTKIDEKEILKSIEIDHEFDKIKNRVNFYSKCPFDDFIRICELFQKYDIKPINLEIKPSSLEEIFLKILGEA